MPSNPAIQDFYPDDFSHCYGCGRLNADGLHVQSHWDGDDMVAHYTPRAAEVAVPGFVYGGLIASLIDCHAMGTASAAVERAAGREIGAATAPRFVTAALRVDYLNPTPHGPELEIRARAREIGERKVIVDATVSVGGTMTARAEIVAVRMPETMQSSPSPGKTARSTPVKAGRVDVFFYGLFMDAELLAEKGLHPRDVRLAWVAELGLRIGQRAVLVPETGNRVHGVLMSLPQTELDQLYGDPSVRDYQPREVMAHVDGEGVFAAVCYNLPEPPASDERNSEYAAKLKEIAARVGLPSDYVASIA